jgi:hypothetical protein
MVPADALQEIPPFTALLTLLVKVTPGVFTVLVVAAGLIAATATVCTPTVQLPVLVTFKGLVTVSV